MFNEDLKTSYIDSLSQEWEMGCAKGVFERTEAFEKEIGKDISEWSPEDELAYLTSMHTRSSNVLTREHYLLCRYFGFVNGDDSTLRDNSTRAYGCLDNERLNASVVTRDEVVNTCQMELENDFEKFIVLGLFEGICGTGFRDLARMRMEDIKYGVFKRADGIEIELSKELLRYARRSNEQKFASVYLGEGRFKERKLLLEDNRIIKRAANVKPGESTVRDARNILNCLLRVKTFTGYEWVDRTNLLESGRIHRMKEMIKGGKSFEEALRESQKINSIVNVTNWTKTYKRYFED